jgi:hypothetical protein
MLVPTEIVELRSANLMVWRAWEQIHVLESNIARWMNSGGHWFDKHYDGDGTLRFTLRFGPLPPEWSLLIGESLHSMRASLDHLAYGLAALEQGRPLTEDEGRKTEFPIYGPEPLSPAMQQRKIGLLSEGLQDSIRKLQPHGNGDYRRTKLWLLHALDNRNKHRSIEPQLMAFSGVMPAFALMGRVSMVTPRSPLHDGLEVFSGTPADPEQRHSLVASMDVVFPWDDPLTEGTVAGERVVTVLFGLHQWVRLIHQQLIGQAGYMVPFPESNAPQDAHDADQRAWSESDPSSGAQ